LVGCSLAVALSPYLVTDEAVAETAARHSRIWRQLDEVSRNALLNTSFRPAPVIRPEYGGTGKSPQAVPAESATESQQGADEILMDLLSAAPPEGIPVAEIITETGMSRRWVFYRLKQLAAAGLAVQVSRGCWRAAL